MPIPSAVTDLSATAASNSPASTESPGDGDDYIRALSAFVKQSYDGALTATFQVNANGVPYSTSMHNPSGTLTGTTNQLICSGTYTPTSTSVANLDANPTTNANWTWTRVGNVVIVAGTFSANPTTASTTTTFDLTLPIASSLTASTQLAGTAVKVDAARDGLVASVVGEPTGDKARVSYYTDSVTTADTWVCQFQYVVL